MDYWVNAAVLILGLMLLGGVLTFYKAKGLLNWRRSLKKEVQSLKKTVDQLNPTQQAAVEIILSHYNGLMNQPLPRKFSLEHFYGYVQSIAAIFNPEKDAPHFQIPLGQLLEAIEQTLMRFQRILKRPGFGMIADLRVRHVLRAQRMINDYRSRKRFAWIRRGLPMVRKLNWMRIWVMGDWISGLLALIRNFAITRLTRYLLADIYLFAGQMALAAFDCDRKEILLNKDQDADVEFADIKAVIEEQNRDTLVLDERLTLLRNNVVGIKRLIYHTPTLADLKKNLVLSAHHIAWRQFPDSRQPLQEATVGAIFDRLTHWLNQLQSGRDHRIVQIAYGWKLQTLVSLHEVQNSPMGKVFKSLHHLTRRQEVGWARWALKLYRWGRRPSPVGIGVSASWFLSRKLILAFLYGRLFDMSCRELMILYAQSDLNGAHRSDLFSSGLINSDRDRADPNPKSP